MLEGAVLGVGVGKTREAARGGVAGQYGGLGLG